MKNVLVLMATYNGEKYLNEQIKSLFAQKNVKVSVLVRDDGSIDNTKKILKKWEDNSSLTWYTGEHLNAKFGFFDLLLEATKRTEFGYFAFCDQDDIWDEDKLEIAIKALSKEKTYIETVYYCGQRLVDERRNFLAVHKLNKKRTEYARFIFNDAAGCTMVFNRKLLNTITSYKPKYLLMHDAWMLKVCLAVGGKIIVDAEAHMSYRQHDNNVVGLKNDFKSKVSRSIRYIKEKNIEIQMLELENGYRNEIIGEYREIIYDIIHSKSSFSSKRKMLDCKKFYYGDIGLQITYILKVLLNCL